MIEARAPGKLFVAGEYAVVVPGEPAVLIAVDREVTVRLTVAEGDAEGHVRSDRYGAAPRVWTHDLANGGIVVAAEPLDYVFAAISVIERVRAARGMPARYFDLEIESERDDASGRKYGLGSSGAVTVAVVAALERFYDLGLTLEERFRLALMATIMVAPRASGGDIAASTYGGWIRYVSPDRDALAAAVAERGVAAALEADVWSACSVTSLPTPTAIMPLIGWTGTPAATESLVEQTRTPVRADAAMRTAFLADSRDCVARLVHAITADSAPEAMEAIRTARGLLQRLAATSGTPIETPLLGTLCDVAEQHGAAGKVSGAGGGDCGIVLAPATLDAAPILQDWMAQGVLPLHLRVRQGPTLAEGEGAA